MMPPPFRVLDLRELRRIGGPLVRRRRLRAVARALAGIVPPEGDGTIHDYVTGLIFCIVRWRPWWRHNREAAFTGSFAVYRVNLYAVVDPRVLGQLVADADEGNLSPGALSARLEGIVRRPADD